MVSIMKACNLTLHTPGFNGKIHVPWIFMWHNSLRLAQKSLFIFLNQNHYCKLSLVLTQIKIVTWRKPEVCSFCRNEPASQYLCSFEHVWAGRYCYLKCVFQQEAVVRKSIWALEITLISKQQFFVGKNSSLLRKTVSKGPFIDNYYFNSMQVW